VLQFEGQCRSYGAVVPYQPILDVLRALCRITETDSPGTMAEKARTTLLDAGLDLLEHAPSLLHVLGLEPEAEHVAGLGPEVTKARVVETLRQVLLKRSRANPLVVVIEDLHWIDRTSEECLASLAEIVGGLRLLFVCTYRHGYRPPWIEKSFSTQIALQRLAPEDSVRIIRGVLGTDQAPEPLVDVIVAKAEGNPFFLEELARAVRDDGGAPSPIRVPDTIQEVLLARIGRLPHEDRELLQTGAVVGKNVSVAVLRALGGLRDDTLQGALTRLTRAEFLYETGAGPDAEYSFKHTLTHEVAYESLAPERRRELHAGHHCGDRAPASGPTRRARRAPGAPRLPRRGLGQDRRLHAASRCESPRGVGIPRSGDVLRAGARGPGAPSGEPGDARAVDRSPIRAADGADPARRARADLRAPEPGPKRSPRHSTTRAAWGVSRRT
jgi:predicted ATPase